MAADVRLIVAGEVRADGSSEDGHRRIIDTFSRLLQVKQIVVLIGSGASMHLGSPSIRRMDKASLQGLLRHQGAEVQVIDGEALDAIVGDTTVDLEDLLAQLSTAVAFAQRAGISTLPFHERSVPFAEVDSLLRALNRALAHACDIPARPGALDDDPWAAHREFFRRMLQSRRSDLPRPRVFTTNYDLVIERTLDDAGIVYFDGFAGTVDRAMQLATYDYEFYLPAAADGRRLMRVPNVLQLMKLHGSINWYSAASPSGRGTHRVIQRSGAPPEGELAMIYPTPQKEFDVVGFPYADLLRLLSAALVSPETALLCVGYGFADEHINRLIYQALPSNPTLQLLIVEPFGVLDGAEFGTSAVADLAQVQDQRIAVVTGEDAKFESLPFSCMPDPERFAKDPAADVMDVLSAALLGSPVAAPIEPNANAEAE